ncbi:MAG: homoserine dehydrogenase, partial [Anaerolineae bacterium]|nr:homoserine dehydrogenase [Anaerolineae bacterium]
VGLGNLGRRFCGILLEKQAELKERYGLTFRLVCAVDSRGGAYNPEGLNLKHIVALKTSGGTIADYPRYGRLGWRAIDAVSSVEADILLEASPVNIDAGAEPGLTCIRRALRKGMHVVSPNKGPFVVAYEELHNLADRSGVKIRFDGTVAGGLPALNIGMRDLRGAQVISIQAVPNLVTGYMMDMLSDGVSFGCAAERAKDEGVLEGDGSWDIDGWDAAAKLTILTKAVMGLPVEMNDVIRTGIRELAPEMLAKARENGFIYRLLARTDRLPDGSLAMSVRPTPLPSMHPLGCLGSKQMGVVYETDIYGTITLIIDEENPIPSSATMLRDILDIVLS